MLKGLIKIALPCRCARLAVVFSVVVPVAHHRRACLAPPCLPSIATLPPRPTIKCCACHIIAELMLSPPRLLSVVTLVLPLCVVSLNFCSAAVPVLPPNYRRACTSLWHVILRRVYFLLPRCSLSPRSAVALALSPLHLR